MKNTINDRALRFLEVLKRKYPVASSVLQFANPWEVLVATILAAQCTDARVNQVTPHFFSRWPNPQSLASAEPTEVEEVIHSVGCYRTKAKNLIKTAQIITAEHNGVVPSEMRLLVQLPGIARKTANIILFAGYGLNEGMAVDTHVKRISYRLGFTTFQDPVKIERNLMEVFKREEWGDLNHRMVAFGREICRARNPRCELCEMAELCPEYANQKSGSEAPDEP